MTAIRNIIAIIMLLVTFGPAVGQLKCKTLPAPKFRMVVTVSSVDNDNRDGVTRIHCLIEGIPHTSQRIDSITLNSDGKNISSVDIDGIDFKRYFQWEDEGFIEVDIDFPHQKMLRENDALFFNTVHGEFSAPLGAAVKR